MPCSHPRCMATRSRVICLLLGLATVIFAGLYCLRVFKPQHHETPIAASPAPTMDGQDVGEISLQQSDIPVDVIAAEHDPIFNAVLRFDSATLGRLIVDKDLLEHRGGDRNAVLSYRCTPLLTAVRIGNIDAARLLVEAGAKSDATMATLIDSDLTAMHLAAGPLGGIEAIDFVRSLGQSLDVRSKSGSTPLSFAVGADRLDKVQHLLELGANANTTTGDGTTMLMLAIEGHCRDEIVQLLLKAGVEVTAKRSDGVTALHLAAEAGDNATLINQLVEAGADVQNIRQPDGFTPLMVASSGRPNRDVLQTLIDRGSQLEARAINGRTPLLLAAATGSASAFQFLLEAGAKPDVVDSQGRGAFEIARVRTHIVGSDDRERIVQLLLHLSQNQAGKH